eukprot:CAMPEP_0195020296 /NCGR_PEP_ID=MMETSP0326_2-20130528/34874_1 /TAXON_ID=2866 ORGANISM="Crypthecodinium cohnii, Strain Seligo" /NCGR_SAMPLE_ID=MMETSP0326_2 /ASSEMBLY_ACC=CAM_ASM_000348 /LENGTH=113 /DNA_ID=CAMNT_0040038851 /DNA_START=109 /DNA_END=447 /DNA_ORIENTATION=-
MSPDIGGVRAEKSWGSGGVNPESVGPIPRGGVLAEKSGGGVRAEKSGGGVRAESSGAGVRAEKSGGGVRAERSAGTAPLGRGRDKLPLKVRFGGEVIGVPSTTPSPHCKSCCG